MHIFSISEQISFLSSMLPLLEGDLIFTGTPSGVGPMQNGDDLELGYGEKTIHSLTVKRINYWLYIFSTLYAFSRKNFGQTSSFNATFCISFMILSNESPIGK